MQRGRLRKNQRVKKVHGRVQNVKDHAQWNKLHSKLGDRLLLALFYAPWSAKCKTMRSFLNDLSSRPELGHVIFAELDIESTEINGLAEEEDVSALPTIQLWKGGQCIHVAKGGDPMEVWQLVKKYAGEKPKDRKSNGRQWHFIGKCAAAGLSLIAAGLLGQRLLSRWSDEEGQLVRSLDKISQRVKDVQKQSKALGRRRRSRMLAQAEDPGATAELRRLYEQQQELSARLEQLRESKDRELTGRAGMDWRSQVANDADVDSDSDED